MYYDYEKYLLHTELSPMSATSIASSDCDILVNFIRTRILVITINSYRNRDRYLSGAKIRYRMTEKNDQNDGGGLCGDFKFFFNGYNFMSYSSVTGCRPTSRVPCLYEDTLMIRCSPNYVISCI